MNNPSLLFTYNASATIRVSLALCNPFRFSIVIHHVSHKAKALFLFRFSKYPIWISRLQTHIQDQKCAFCHTDQLRRHGETSSHYLPFIWIFIWRYVVCFNYNLFPNNWFNCIKLNPSNVKVFNKITSQLVNYSTLFYLHTKLAFWAVLLITKEKNAIQWTKTTTMNKIDE